jgi:signal transduction histidine kinase
LTENVENKFISLKELIEAYDIWKKLFRMWELQWDNLNIITNKSEDLVNLIIIDKNKMKLLFSNVTYDLSVSFVEDILNNNEYWKIYQDKWFFIKKIFVNEKNNNYDVLFIKNLRYSFLDYLTDLLGFVFISLLFSVLFYYIWLIFVSKNLKPVENNMRDMQDFIHNAWHELKTPISVIHSNLQIIKATKIFDENLIKEWIIEINRLDHLIESLIELSNINSTWSREKLIIKNEIEKIVNDFKVEADKKDINIKINILNEKILIINKQYFYILFSNLVWNAIKYTNKWWIIEIFLEKDKLRVKDNWIWMNKENLDKIFDRFFIIEKSRNTKWYWIWLSLVKKIADIYKWNINVKSEENNGSEFIVEF